MKRRHDVDELDILADLIRGGRHSRVTVARSGVSLQTADRWLKRLAEKVPGVRKVRESQTSWFEWRATRATWQSWEDARADLAQKAADQANHAFAGAENSPLRVSRRVDTSSSGTPKRPARKCAIDSSSTAPS